MAQTIRNQASKTKVTYMSGKAPKEDTYYNTTQLSCLIFEMAQIKGQEETIKYLQNKVKQLKTQGGGK